MEGKYLITTDAWFYAPDGMKYRSVWGEVKILNDSVLGVKTNRNSVNWFAFVGSQKKGVLIAGCQIHYAVKCPEKPNTGSVLDFTYTNGELHTFNRPSEIYDAE